jgi:CBS domain containing-hemolysin-like protein
MFLLAAAVVVLVLVLVPVSLVQVLYLEALRLKARETPALEFFKQSLEPRLGLKLEEGAFLFSVMKHTLLGAMATLVYAVFGAALDWIVLAEAIGISSVAMVLFAHVVPQVLYRQTRAKFLWAALPFVKVAALALRPLLVTMRFMRTLADLRSPDEPVQQKKVETEQQIEALITAGKQEGIIAEDDRRLIQSVVEFGNKTVREVMTPRNDIVAVSEDDSLDKLREAALRERYSRLPVCDGGIDNVTGFVHVRDMYELDPSQRRGRKVRDIKRKIRMVPETKPVDDVLRLMQQTRDHMVVVIDEYGNTAGLATMEDLVEEIVGEIGDEHEPERDVVDEGGGAKLVSGNLDLDRLEELVGFAPPEGTESTTIGGLVTEWLGHVPAVGESVEREGVKLEVVSGSDRRVSQVRITRSAKEPTNGEAKRE